MPRRQSKSVTIRNTEFIFRTNFRGEPSEYNKTGDKEFNVVLDPDTEDILKKEGWNVKRTTPKNEGEEPEAYLPVRINFDSAYPPRVWLINAKSGKRTMLDDDTIGQLDYFAPDEIDRVNVVVNPSHWENKSLKRSGIKAYCQKLMVYFLPDPFEEEYEAEFGVQPDIRDEEEEDDIPF